MGDLYEYNDVDGFTSGAIGRPGQRTFFLQVRADGNRLNFKCEKQQVAALAQYLQRILADLPSPSDRPIPQSLELIEPVQDVAFVVGHMGLAYDADVDRVVVMIEEFVPTADNADDDDTIDLDEPTEEEIRLFDDVDDAGRLRVALTRGQALAFAERAEAIVTAGRPPCVWCALPIDPDGHACPRMN